MSNSETTSNYNFTDCKPLEETLATKDLLKLEHKYRILLKESGFEDVEMWDNRPKEKVKKLRFIKGKIRVGNKHITDKISYYKKGFVKLDFVRIVSLFAYHSPDVFPKYAPILQDYSLTGSLLQSLRNTNSPYKYDTVQKYVRNNFHLMLKFVREEFGDE